MSLSSRRLHRITLDLSTFIPCMVNCQYKKDFVYKQFLLPFPQDGIREREGDSAYAAPIHLVRSTKIFFLRQ